MVREIACKKYHDIAFLDDNSPIAIGKIDNLERYKYSYDAIVAIGNQRKRKEIIERLEVLCFNIVSIISDKAFVSQSSIIEAGCVIEPMAVINTGAKIKKGTFINAGAIVNHNEVVSEFCK